MKRTTRYNNVAHANCASSNDITTSYVETRVRHGRDARYNNIFVSSDATIPPPSPSTTIRVYFDFAYLNARSRGRYSARIKCTPNILERDSFRARVRPRHIFRSTVHSVGTIYFRARVTPPHAGITLYGRYAVHCRNTLTGPDVRIRVFAIH